jgi:AraC-like DNA-binding protein
MYPIRTVDEVVYNQTGDVILKINTKSVYSGFPMIKSNMYPYFEIWMLQSPYCTINMYSSAYSLIEGDILIFSSNDDKDIIDCDNNATFLSLQIDSHAFNECMPSSPLFSINNFLNFHSKNFNNKISGVSPVGLEIREFFSSILLNLYEKNQGYEIEIFNKCLSTLLIVARETNYCDSSVSSSGSEKLNKSHKALKRAIDYIDGHLGDELTLEKISAVANLSPNYLSNIFREQVGVRLWDYISEKRINLATQLLVESPNDSIISIALKCGFNNCPNFNRSFKKYTGQTPKKYKTSILRKENGNE